MIVATGAGAAVVVVLMATGHTLLGGLLMICTPLVWVAAYARTACA